jgi:hypothetical protein
LLATLSDELQNIAYPLAIQFLPVRDFFASLRGHTGATIRASGMARLQPLILLNQSD